MEIAEATEPAGGTVAPVQSQAHAGRIPRRLVMLLNPKNSSANYPMSLRGRLCGKPSNSLRIRVN